MNPIKHIARQRRANPMLPLAPIFLLLALFSTPCRAQDPAAAQVFDISKDGDFANYRQVVTSYIGKRQTQKTTQVCLLGKTASDSSKMAWLIWEAGQEIVLYDQGETNLKHSRRKLNLKNDVVETEAELNGSTYLVTRAWVTQLQLQCQQYGSIFSIKKTRR
jgi:hypothetical protein